MASIFGGVFFEKWERVRNGSFQRSTPDFLVSPHKNNKVQTKKYTGNTLSPGLTSKSGVPFRNSRWKLGEFLDGHNFF